MRPRRLAWTRMESAAEANEEDDAQADEDADAKKQPELSDQRERGNSKAKKPKAVAMQASCDHRDTFGGSDSGGIRGLRSAPVSS